MAIKTEVTVEIDNRLLRQVKIIAAREGKPLREFLADQLVQLVVRYKERSEQVGS